MHILTSLLLLIIFARLFGKIFKRFNQPEIVGEMLAGVILGPSCFNIIQTNEALSGISELAVFLVVLSAGLEMNFKDVVGVLRSRGIIVASIGFIIPFLSGLLIGAAFQMDIMRTIFLGLCISITALPVAVRILQNFKLLDSDIAKYSIATAIFNDLIALLVLGIILNLQDQQTSGEMVFTVFSKIWQLLFLIIIIVSFNLLVKKLIDSGIHIERLSEKIVEILGNEALFGILVSFVLVFGSISETLGFHFIIGAFFGALLIEQKFFLASRYNELQHTLASITEGFLAPVFFAYIGLEMNFSKIDSILFLVVVIVVSVLSKILSGWVGGKVIGLTTLNSLGIGIILNGRGIMELVIASIAYQHGFINQGMFSALVLMGVVTTLLTPILFRKYISPKLDLAPPTLQTGLKS